MDLLVFELAGQRLGLKLADVLEVSLAVSALALPRAPAVVEGVIDLRGTLVPLVDLRGRLGFPPKPVALTDHLVFCRAAGRVVAFRVDRALDLTRVPDAALLDLDAVAPGVPLVAGVVRLADGLILVHDLQRFLSAAEEAALTQALAARDVGDP